MEIMQSRVLDVEQQYGQIRAFVLGGAIFCYPTDTCYALGANALMEDAVHKIYYIKDRERSKPLPVIVRDLGVAAKFAVIGPRARAVLDAFPGISVVVPKQSIPDIVNPSRIMLRIPSDARTQSLMRGISVPIISTSANRAGDPNPYTVGDVSASLSDKLPLIDFAIDAGRLPPTPSSTILDCVEGKVYREGVYAAEDVLEVFYGAD
jgi:L-threonylcarbamoyladenylate synthase